MSEPRTSVTSFSGVSSNDPRSVLLERNSRLGPRPTLSQILADQAPSPWTLDAFTAYADRNMCLENIEFIQDAERYRSAYAAVLAKSQAGDRKGETQPLRRMDSAQTETLKEMWTRIMLLYVAPSSPKEVNLPSDIRAGLAPLNKSTAPASPHLLDPAVRKIFELIEDSILFSFLGEVNSSYQPSIASRDEMDVDVRPSTDLDMPRAHFATHAAQKKSPKASGFGFSKSRSQTQSSKGRPPSLVPAPGEEVLSATVSPTSSRGVVSPTPKTPPSSSEGDSKKLSPRPRKDASWKRMSARFGFTRKNSSNLRDVAEDLHHGSIDER